LLQPIDTIKTLDAVQRCLQKAEANGDAELGRDAECVLSALVLVLRYRRARLKPTVSKSLERIMLA